MSIGNASSGEERTGVPAAAVTAARICATAVSTNVCGMSIIMAGIWEGGRQMLVEFGHGKCDRREHWRECRNGQAEQLC